MTVPVGICWNCRPRKGKHREHPHCVNIRSPWMHCACPCRQSALVTSK